MLRPIAYTMVDPAAKKDRQTLGLPRFLEPTFDSYPMKALLSAEKMGYETHTDWET
ncbi:hypothetical protein RMSM_04865 [Rhodopirellula maiorica SM1]|uniref:Uncharacterized protein n=1 Tax=Rhodopirellula maiorica SM1 TaxID=1265738 RepID=M5RS54_9BACT|nr:hypothetical protein RMSM_04865 [Rhodopirellula maiorica SM1]